MELPETAKPIKGAKLHWVDRDGSIYCIDQRNYHQPALIKKKKNIVHGYEYVGINYEGRGTISKRVHRLVAEAFLDNPESFPVVGHKNNIKNDNRVENLYWTTTSENTQKAVDDGLLVNDKGFDDSQSIPVNMYDTYTGKLIKTFGSAKEASRETGITSTGILNQCKKKPPTKHKMYFRFADDQDTVLNQNLIGMCDFETDKILELFINIGEASRKTGVRDTTISTQCLSKAKPKWAARPFYFRYVSQQEASFSIGGD